MRSTRDLPHSALSLILLVAFAGIAGCGSAESPGVMVSPPGWVVVPSGGQHANSATMTYISNGGSSSCAECHGADLSGGTSNVSCFGNPSGCHHGPVAGWLAPPPAAQEHGAAAKRVPGSSGFASCQICHGVDFTGGGSQVPCFTCHGANAPHPAAPWHGPTFSHVDTNASNAPVCAQCHFPGSPNNPANHPATPAPPGTPPGCLNATLCHGSTGETHPVPYNDNAHYNVVAGTFGAACGACHDLAAPSAKAGPACGTCHAAGSPLIALNCASCHAAPPDGNAPAGAAYPNIAGAHSTHIALNPAGTPSACDPCHNGLGSGTLNHYNRANALPGMDASRVPPGDVAFPGTYNAESGPAAFNAANRTCSNVICHGGQATPDWRTAMADAIDVPNACLGCHASGTTQYNSFSSGSHDNHIVVLGLNATTCKRCHDEARVNVSGHFQNLATPAFEQPARETILPAVRYNGSTCNPAAGGVAGCHGNERW
ncbi:MAG: CxxxxCH/CxxCH domain-containing protein [Deltaproteobacteria bacterium]|nr:MAG: CxxxxCH/CxxCH domain-containing protein [Deltaproteobacteria bacterium]